MQKSDPFATLDTSELDKVLKAERAAAQRMGLENEIEVTPTTITSDPQPKLQKSEPWLRRDYSRWERAWWQIATAPMDEVGVEYQTEQDARNARTEFYKARAALKQSQPKDMDLPSEVAELFEWSINLRRAATPTGNTRWWLVFRRIGTEIDIQYELPKFE